MKRITRSAAVIAMTAIMAAANILGAGISVSAAENEEIILTEEDCGEAEPAAEAETSDESTEEIPIYEVDPSEEIVAGDSADIEVTDPESDTGDDSDLLANEQVFTVHFEETGFEDKDGNTRSYQFPDQKVKYGQYATEPDPGLLLDLDYVDPVWKYYPTAKGGSWFASKDFNFKTMPITQDITLMLGYCRKTIKVTFDPQNGEEPFTEDVTKGDTLLMSIVYEYRHDFLHGVKREGYDLLGWALTKDANEGMYLYAVWAKSETNWGDIPQEIVDALGLTTVPKGLWLYDYNGGKYGYTGSPVTPDKLSVFFGNELLLKDHEYTITAANNINAATADSAKAPSYTISLIGFRKGDAEDLKKTFTITPFSLEKNKSALTYEKDAYFSFNKKVQKYKPQITVSLPSGAVTLKENTDYTLEYNDTSKDGKKAYCDPGDYTVTVKGKGNFAGNIYVTEHITNTALMSDATVKGLKNYTYNGTAFTQDSLVVKLGKTTLVKDKDFTVSYRDNKAAGKAAVIITAVPGSSYQGTKTVFFTIKKRPLKGLNTADIIKPINDYPAGPVTFDFGKLTLPIKEENRTLTLKGCEKSVFDKLEDSAKKNYDYTYEYSNNNKAGKAKVTFAGVNSFSGKVSSTFKIQTAELSESNKNLSVKVKASYTYTKGSTTPDPELTYKGVKLTKGVDYAVSYKNNSKVSDGTGKNAPTIIITGKGNFKGTIKKTFAITASTIQNCNFEYEIYIKYKNKKNNYKNKIVVRDTNGKVLKEGVDYTVTYTLAHNVDVVYKDGDKVEDRTMVCAYITGIGNYKSPHKEACIYQLC